jgi:hypothetical protein
MTQIVKGKQFVDNITLLMAKNYRVTGYLVRRNPRIPSTVTAFRRFRQSAPHYARSSAAAPLTVLTLANRATSGYICFQIL